MSIYNGIFFGIKVLSIKIMKYRFFSIKLLIRLDIENCNNNRQDLTIAHTN